MTHVTHGAKCDPSIAANRQILTILYTNSPAASIRKSPNVHVAALFSWISYIPVGYKLPCSEGGGVAFGGRQPGGEGADTRQERLPSIS